MWANKMTETDQLIDDWLAKGRMSLAQFCRSPLHDQLKYDVREAYTKAFEDYPDAALAECAHYLKKAKKPVRRPRSMSNSQSPEGCWELGTQKSPQRIKAIGIDDYAYRFVALVLSATLPHEREVVRHRCHNRKCLRPDHLQIGSPEENLQDDKERSYAGRDSAGG